MAETSKRAPNLRRYLTMIQSTIRFRNAIRSHFNV